MLIFAAPGQGSQSQGFLTPWLEAFPGLKQRLAEYSEACGKDLVELGTTAGEDTIRDTSVAQPLIVGATLAVYRECFDGQAQGVVGHSVGEFAAAAIAGIISDAEAMQLVAIRANAMAEAAALEQSSMAAVLGGEESAVMAAIEQHELYAANYNGAGQIVAAGSRPGIDALVSAPPERARVIELKVAGAFHTPFMATAVAKLEQAAASMNPKDPAVSIWTNKDGSEVRSGQQYLDFLVAQTALAVRWDKCMNQLQNLSAKVVELPPAGALSGLIKRGAPAASALALKNPEDVSKVSTL